MPTFKVIRERAHEVACDVLAVPVYKDGALGPGAKEVEAALGVSFSDLFEAGPLLGKAFTGSLGEVIAVPTLGKLPAKQVLLVGVGEKAKGKPNVARKAGATIARKVGGARMVVTTVPQAVKGGADAVVSAFVEGFLLASYRYDAYKTNGSASRPNRVEDLRMAAGANWDARKLAKAIERAEVYAAATNLARDLTNTPSGDKSPESLAQQAREIAKAGLKVKVFDEKELEAKGFGGILGVGRGSPKPPRLVELRYEPPGAKRTIAFVGKGITFDSGGINIKPSEGLDWMKSDMGGAAAVLGAMLAISKLKPKGVAVRAYVATSENMPDGNALHPGDVIRQYGGKTVEIGNTDAEGRLVMADAIVYAREQGAEVVVDVATLTGAQIMATGKEVFAVLGNDKAEVKRILDAAERAGEHAWQLPLHEGYRDALRSDIADIRNIVSKNVGAGTITAALFLSEFAEETSWVHLDIAGPVKSDGEEFERPKGATGAAVRTLVEYALSYAQ